MARKGTTSEAQGRFTVALPKEFGALVDQVGVRIGAAVRRETGVAVELSRAQIVQSLIRSALDSQPNGDTPADATTDDADTQPAAAAGTGDKPAGK